MNKFTIHKQKTLKLQNVISKKINMTEQNDINRDLIDIQNYLKAKGCKPIGPAIQQIKLLKGKDNIDVDINVMGQSNRCLEKVEPPFMSFPSIKVENCLYVRYQGPEDKLQFAYQKLNLLAFEEDIELSGNNYTVFIDNKEGNIVADVFMERSEL